MSKCFCSKKTMLSVVLFLLSCGCCGCYNLDTKFAVVYNGSRGSYFGYTTALHRNRWGSLALVGAPRENTTTLNNTVYQTGTLFRCKITDKGIAETCQEVTLMTEGDSEISNAYRYWGRKDSMWLGVSLAVRPSKEQNDVVTCGHLWKNQYYSSDSKSYLVSGVCYVINGDLEEKSVEKLVPLREDRYREYNHDFGQAGISSVFSEDGFNLILGAPGIMDWKGSIVNYQITPGSKKAFDRRPIPRPPNEINYDSYLGYSLTSGKFFQSGIELFAVGAPRDDENKGKVYIVELESYAMKFHQRLRGKQLGEYFGASVLAVKLDRDSHTDLLVGAPLNSLDTGGDEGKVYVYLSNGNDLEEKIVLTGDGKEDARFGTALSNIGDLNKDDYTDIAVGAPYEDGSGAVYIFHGSDSGVKTPYVQKLKPSSVSAQLSGFGIHISSGMDIDNNIYPDILVGSYLSSNAVLFRSRPVIKVQPEMITKQIIENQMECEEYQNHTCVKIDACLSYSGKSVNSSLEFQLTVSEQDPSHRVFFTTQNGDEVRPSSEITSRKVLRIDKQECWPFKLYLNSGIKDRVTPIPIHFSHALVLPFGSETAFQKSFPVYHEDTVTNITSDLTFQTGCKEEDKCLSDLVVTVRRTEPAGGGAIVLGNVSRLALEITVENTGEPAYFSELLIMLPPEIFSINDDSCEAGNQQNNASLVCYLGNPLSNNTKVEFNIKLDITKIPPHTKYLEIVCRAVTRHSSEINWDDNEQVLRLDLQTISDIAITGATSQDQIMYNGTLDSPPNITHTYTVSNRGPSPLEKIEILLEVPYLFLSSSQQTPFLSLTGLERDSEMPLAIPAICDESFLKHRGKSTAEEVDLINSDDRNEPIAPSNLEDGLDVTKKIPNVETTVVHGEEKRAETSNALSPKKGHIVINCDDPDVECIEIRCFATPFANLRKFAQIAVDFQLNFDILDDHLSPWYQIEFVTNGIITVPNTLMKEKAQIKTLIIHEVPPPPPKLADWIIFACVVVGILLFLLILILLIKIGFFRRKEKAKMKELLDEDNNKEVDNFQSVEEETEILDE